MIDEDKILAYILGELDEAEHQEVEKALAQDQNLRQMAEQFQQLQWGFRAKRIKILEQEVAAFDKTLETPAQKNEGKGPDQNKNNSGFKFWMLIPILLILLAGTFFYGKFYYSDAALAKKHFLMPIDPAVAGDQDANTYTQAVDAFFSGKDYEETIRMLSAIADSNAYFASAQYLMAHAEFLKGDYSQASSEFTDLIQRKNEYPPEQQRRIEWNAVVSRLATGDTAINIPEQWSNSEQAVALNQDLQSFWRKLFH